jgi:DMSO/TMAO reductase YedYZ molybdopterin-dependent catalytic subunit
MHIRLKTLLLLVTPLLLLVAGAYIQWGTVGLPAPPTGPTTTLETAAEPCGFPMLVENQLGYTMVKWIEAIEFVEGLQAINKGEGGYKEDHEYFGELASI